MTALKALPPISERGILDTSVVIATDVAPLPGLLAISASTIAELHFGVFVAKDVQTRAERLRRLNFLQHRFDALPIDEAVAVQYGRLAAAVVESGRKPRIRVMDLIIAATAVTHNATLYTRNPADFRGLEHLVPVGEAGPNRWDLPTPDWS